MKQIPTHSKYAPSSLERIAACPGSIHACEGLPPRPAEDLTEQGTTIHAMIAAYLTAHPYTTDSVTGEAAIMEAMTHANPEADEVAIELATWCVEYAYQQLDAHPSAEMVTERRVNVPDMYYGTCDVLIKTQDRLIVIDWKTGYKEVTEAANNLQGKAYALAASLENGLKPVEVRFFMPRIHKDSAAYFEDIQGLYDEIDGIIEASQDAEAQLHHGNHCTYCAANYWHTCPLLAGIAAAEAARNCDSMIRTAEPAELIRQYGILKQLAERFENLKKMLTEQIKAAPDGKYAGFTSKALGGGMECINIPATLAMASPVIPEADALAYCSLSIDKLAAEYGRRAKDAGSFKTAKEGKEAFLTNIAGYTKPKPPRVTIVPPSEE